MRVFSLIIAGAVAALIGTTGSANAQWNWNNPYEPEPSFPYIPPPNIPGPTTPGPTIPIPIPTPGPSVPDTGATRLQIGIPSRTPFGNVQGVDITTTEIDNFLANRTVVSFGGVTIDPDFGSSFSRDLANLSFQKLRSLETKLEAAITREVTERVDTVVEGYSTDLDISPFNLNFAQTGRFLDLQAGDLEAEFVGKVRVPYCGTVKARVFLSEINAFTRLDLGNGVAINTGSDIEVDDVEVSTGNPLKWACIRLGDIVINKNKRVSNGIRDSINTSINLVETQKVLGVNDILVTSAAFIENNISSIPAVAQQQNNAIMALTQAMATINNENFSGSGVEIDFTYDDSTNNFVSLVARHGSVNIGHLEYASVGVLVTLDRPANTKRTFIYAKYPGSSTWYKIATTSSNAAVLGQLPKGTQLVAIGENNAISGLYSQAGRIRATTWDFNCWAYSGNCPVFY